MGGAFITGGAIICDGDDVLSDLNYIFGDPTSEKYKEARAQKEYFAAVGKDAGNYEALITAYEKAGLEVSKGWKRYLKLLGSVNTEGAEQGPTNIWNIAQFRYTNLTDNKAMITGVHVPQHGGHVHTGTGSGSGPNLINSPCPLPQDKY